MFHSSRNRWAFHNNKPYRAGVWNSALLKSTVYRRWCTRLFVLGKQVSFLDTSLAEKTPPAPSSEQFSAWVDRPAFNRLDPGHLGLKIEK